MTPGQTSVEAVNNAVAGMGINASVESLPESHTNAPVGKAAEDLAAEAEATANQTPADPNAPQSTT